MFRFAIANRHLAHLWIVCNPPVTARVKISQNCDIHAKVYLVQGEHCQTLRVVSTFTGQNESTVFDC